MDKEIEECPSCKGTGTGKVNPLTKWLVNKDDYEPLDARVVMGQERNLTKRSIFSIP